MTAITTTNTQMMDDAPLRLLLPMTIMLMLLQLMMMLILMMITMT